MPALNNDQIDDQLLFEQQESFAGGEDNYRRSTLLDPDQCQKLINIIVRDNYEAWTRPGADEFAEVLPGAVRALAYFDTPTSKQILAVANGILHSCGGKNLAWAELDYTASNTNILVEMAQGVDSMLISDGTNACAILDAALTVTTCTTGANDPPKANILCWHTGRMFAAGFDSYRDTLAVSNRLAFGNGQWNLTTRSFRIGSGDGDPITALHSMQGNMLAVFKANSIWIANTDPTAEPPDFQSATVVESLGFGVGCVGKRAVAAVANDVFFMAQDGVRSLQRMQAAAAQWQLSAPISLPVQQYINRINWNAQSGIVAKSYKELVFFAVPLDSSSTNNATLVYNTRLQRWLGCWLGWTPTAFCKSRFGSIENLLISDTAGYVNYWKDADDSNNPATYFDRLAPVAWKIWPRALRFNDPVCTKTAYNCVLRFTAGNATANISAVLDLVSAKSFTEIFTAEGDKLGVGKLGSFRLASVKPIKVEQSLRSLPSFSEMYLRIEGTSGWIKLRNFTVSAFLNAIEG